MGLIREVFDRAGTCQDGQAGTACVGDVDVLRHGDPRCSNEGRAASIVDPPCLQAGTEAGSIPKPGWID